MLVRAVFPYELTYIVPRGTKHRSAAVLSEVALDIREVSAEQAPVAFTVVPHPEAEVLLGTAYVKTKPWSILWHRGSFWWPMRDLYSRQHVSAAELVAEIGKPDGHHVSGKAFGDRRNSFRAGPRHPDVLGLGGRLGAHRDGEWPTGRFEDLPIRKVVRTDLEHARSAIEAAADGVIFRDGLVWYRSGEPVWMLKGRLQNFDPVRQRLQVRIADPEAVRKMAGRAAPKHDGRHVYEEHAFLDYETFRADRRQDAARRAEEMLRDDPFLKSELSPSYERGLDDTLMDHGAAQVAGDPLTDMLHGLAGLVEGFVEGKVSELRKTYLFPPLGADASDEEIVASRGAAYLGRMLGFVRPPPGASAREAADALEALLVRLEGVDASQEAFGYLTSLVLGMRRAAVRTAADAAAGLIPSAVFAPEDEDALAMLS